MAKQIKRQGNGNGNGNEQGMELAKDRVREVRSMLARAGEQIEAALAKQLDPDQFVRTCLTTYQRGGDAMLKADSRSFVAACIEAAQLGLKPDGVLQEVYLIPRYNKHARCVVVSMQIGYRGFMKLARRSMGISDLTAEVVRANDEFMIKLGTDRGIHHIPHWVKAGGRTEPGDIIGAYATAKLVSDGSVAFKAIPRFELDRTARLSGGPNQEMSNFWHDHYDAMAMKTAMRRLCKWLDLTGDMERAVRRDEIRSEGGMDEDLRAVIDTIVKERSGQSGTVEEMVPPAYPSHDESDGGEGSEGDEGEGEGVSQEGEQ